MLLCMYFNLVCKLFLLEVFEIVDGLVEIVVVVWEVGYCFKIVVWFNVVGLNVKGVCIGLMG